MAKIIEHHYPLNVFPVQVGNLRYLGNKYSSVYEKNKSNA